MKDAQVYIILCAFALIIAGCVGWVMNVVKLVQADFEEPYREEVIRIIGLTPPVGAVIGWINFKE